MDEQGSSGRRRLLAAAVLVVLMAGDAIRYSLSWWGYAAVVLIVLIGTVAVLAREGAPWRRVPVALWAFLALVVLSVAWSFYPGATALGAVLTLATTAAGLFLAGGLVWTELVRLLRGVLGAILVLSLLFELVVAVAVRGPLLPLWVDYSGLEEIPGAFYWSRGLLLEGGRIQGIVGNANLLGMLALAAIIVFLAAFSARLGSRGWNAAGVLLAVATLALTRSTTVLVALAATAFVVLAAWLTARARGRARIAVQAGAAVLAFASIAAVVALRESLLALAGKSPDLTNRLAIWDAVGALAVQRPVAGWGWVGYWNPFVEPFDDLIVFGGVTYFQAHNAWLDVLLQLGWIGLLALLALALGITARLWYGATEAGRSPLEGLLPIALIVALLTQSLAESRLLIEWGWALLVVLALRSTAPLPAPVAERRGAEAPS